MRDSAATETGALAGEVTNRKVVRLRSRRGRRPCRTREPVFRGRSGTPPRDVNADGGGKRLPPGGIRLSRVAGTRNPPR